MNGPRRWVAWSTLVMVVGGSGAVAVAARRPSRPPAASDTVLVRVGKEAITAATVQKRIDELPEQVRPNYGTPEGRQRLLERMVEERVWLMSAVQHGVDTRPEVKRQLEQQRRDFLIRTHISEIMAANPAPSDSDARSYYEAHRADYRVPAAVTLAHVQLKSEAEARRIKQWAKAGQDWRKLVAKYSTDTLTRENGGALGTVTREGAFGSLGSQPALAESAFAVGEGKIGGPFKTDRGWHVIKVESVRTESTRPFEQLAGTIMRQLGSKRSQEFYEKRLAETKASLGVRADSNAIHKFLAQKRSARDLFNEAQSAGPAAARIEAYRRLLEAYPSSEVSPQAQFMVGFIYSEELKDYDAAEKAFHELVDKYPKSELITSARWMLEHMRSEGAPDFMNLESDSSHTSTKIQAGKHPSGKP
ncbi:MAG TPA: peptidyl-prolyl cis-trans isomerase [Candidatus Eisenbacteria bacterium]